MHSTQVSYFYETGMDRGIGSVAVEPWNEAVYTGFVQVVGWKDGWFGGDGGRKTGKE